MFFQIRDIDTTSKVLNISHKAITDEDLRSIALLPMSDLRSLDLSHNSFSKEGFIFIRQILEKNPHLYSLNLSGNYMGDEAVAELAQYPQLRRLTLRHMRLTDQAIEGLITKESSIEKLDIADNDVAEKGFSTLVSSPIVFINFKKNPIKEESIKKLLIFDTRYFEKVAKTLVSENKNSESHLYGLPKDMLKLIFLTMVQDISEARKKNNYLKSNYSSTKAAGNIFDKAYQAPSNSLSLWKKATMAGACLLGAVCVYSLAKFIQEHGPEESEEVLQQQASCALVPR